MNEVKKHPLLAVRAIIQNEDDGILLLKRASKDEYGDLWCLPGGKVVFYTGILPICDNVDGVAAVMGHEVAHAFAKHGQERMTTSYGQQLGGVAVAVGTASQDEETRILWNSIYGVGSQVGMLAYSRTHENEADKLGMVFMIMAGYNPEEAINVWVRMSQQKGSGGQPPEFLSTHPDPGDRVENFQNNAITSGCTGNKNYKTEFEAMVSKLPQ